MMPMAPQESFTQKHAPLLQKGSVQNDEHTYITPEPMAPEILSKNSTNFDLTWHWRSRIKPCLFLTFLVIANILMLFIIIDCINDGFSHYAEYHSLQKNINIATKKAKSDHTLLTNKDIQKDKQRLFHEMSEENLKKYLMMHLPTTWIDIKLSLVGGSEGLFMELPFQKEMIQNLNNQSSTLDQRSISLYALGPLLSRIASFPHNPQTSSTNNVRDVKGVRIVPYNLTLETMEEDDFFQILNLLRHQTPCYCIVSQYQLTRIQAMTQEFLEALKQKGPAETPFLYRGSINFFVVTFYNELSSFRLHKESRSP